MRWNESTEETLKQMETDPERGLSEEEAEKRLTAYGPNTLREKRKTGIAVKFFRQFNDFMIMVLLAAAAVSLSVTLVNGEGDFA
ncbi:MAG: HAD family hydrolase, partial [Clostridiales bacterium]|nr:HAD family hydrolase [Clostridiales bacterium]